MNRTIARQVARFVVIVSVIAAAGSLGILIAHFAYSETPQDVAIPLVDTPTFQMGPSIDLWGEGEKLAEFSWETGKLDVKCGKSGCTDAAMAFLQEVAHLGNKKCDWTSTCYCPDGVGDE